MTNMVLRNGKPLNPDDFEEVDESGRAEAMRQHHREQAEQFHQSGVQSSGVRYIGTPRLGKHHRKLRV